MLHMEDMTWPELDALDREKTVIFIAFSPLEEHGPHLPIGTDFFVARHFADHVARLVEARRPDVTALIVPPVPLGAGTVPMRGSVNVSVDLVYDIARQMGAAFARDGFRYIVFTNGHLGAWHMLALENAAAWVSRKYRMHAIAPSASLVRELIRRGLITEAIGDRLSTKEIGEFLSAAHGGMLETSVMLALRPDLVKPLYGSLPRLARSALLGWRGRQPAAWPGYIGSPAQGAAEWGQITLDALSDAGAKLVIRVLDEGRKGARTARIFPRVPFWLAARKWGIMLVAGAAGASVTLMATRIITNERADHRVKRNRGHLAQ